MYRNLYLLIIVILFSNEVLGKNANNIKNIKNVHKQSDKKHLKVINDRGKRSLSDTEKAFLTHMGKGFRNENLDGLTNYASEEFVGNAKQKDVEKEPPFWGTRGRRDGSSESAEYVNDENIEVKCTTCDKYYHDFYKNVIKEELDPFWFERGVKDKSKEFSPFWGNRGRRDETEPFWGNRGRRDEMEPFWGNRGKKDEMEPFWGNRGKRDDVEPFWGNRGRRDEIEPFWGNRGKREDSEPFWGTRGRRETKTSMRGNFYWINEGRKKTALKESIMDAMDNIKHSIEKLARMRRMGEDSSWNTRGRDNKLENMVKQQARNRNPHLPYAPLPNKQNNKPTEQNTVLDERMYAEQPHFILIERNSRSSAEEDPFFISRGKKYTNAKLPKGVRDRRGVLEELVKSVRTDPYYIARGKKDSNYIQIGNSTILKDKFLKAKDLICSAIDLLVVKNEEHKVKRDVDESERERRTILKKLAAQLQMDPYFVSRGKKNGDTDVNEDRLEEFINQVSEMCN